MRVVPHLVATVLIIAPAARAQEVRTNLDCYQQSRQVTVSGAGFTPGATYTVARDGVELGTGVVKPDGTMSGEFSSGTLPSGIAERAFVVEVTDGSLTGTFRYRVTRFSATWLPRRAGPLEGVRFSAFGFGYIQPIYVHYVRPSGASSAATVRLGRGRGPCGKLARTMARHLFPFRPAPGSWKLQFDTQEMWSRTSVPRLVVPVKITRTKR